MNNRQRFLSLEVSYLAEGTEKTRNSMGPTNHWDPIPIVQSAFVVNEHSAEEGAHVGVEPEGRDEVAQDSALTIDEIKSHPA